MWFLGSVVQINDGVEVVGRVAHVPEVSAQDVSSGGFEVDGPLIQTNRRAAVDISARDDPVIDRDHVRAKRSEHISLPCPTDREWVVIGDERALELEVAIIDQLHLLSSGSNSGESQAGLGLGCGHKRQEQANYNSEVKSGTTGVHVFWPEAN